MLRLVSRPLFGLGLDLGLAVMGLGIGLGLMKNWSRSHAFWSRGLECVLCSVNTHAWSS